jgi:IrrE N-terminal-like domain
MPGDRVPHHPHPLNRWLPEIDYLVRGLRGPQSIRFDLAKIAARANVTVGWRSLQYRLQGITLDSQSVILRDGLRGAQANFTFSHELAHVFRRRGHFVGLRESEEEWFADWFAREMLLPRTWLDREWLGQELAAAHIDRMTAALQLSVVGRAPSIMRHGDRVLCRVCGVHHHRWGCECAALRCASPRDRHRLPEAPSFFRPTPTTSFAQLSILDNYSRASF